jgi:hypothetical protein
VVGNLQKKNVVKKGTNIDENDKKVLKAYRKKIIEQRNEIEDLKKQLAEEKKKNKNS